MLKPQKDWILVEVIEEPENVSPGGILLPVTKRDTKKVKLISFGPKANPAGLLKEGDIILCLAHHGLEVKHSDETYEFMREENFLGFAE